MDLAVCRILPGEKKPTYKEWTLRSLEPDEFHDGDSIGIQAGRLSDDLVHADIDSAEALAQADRLLPPTRMTDGRAGKPLSHRFYRVRDIPPEFIAPAHAGGGIGGPRTRRLRGPDGMIVELGGTGSQVVAPPSIWTSKDGRRQERRAWAMLEEPAVIDCRELYDAVFRLAKACGWTEKTRPDRRERTGRKALEEWPLVLPTGEPARQARQYLTSVPPAVAGQGGNDHTFTVAAILVIEFGLSPEDALPVLLEWNRRCSPPWTANELRHKLEAAAELERDDHGWRVRKKKGSVLVNVLADDPFVYVGLDVKKDGRSFVNLEPSLFAGMVKAGTGWELVPELAAVPWQGKHVLIAPASTVVTNAREVWADFFLARLLRQHGADVMSLRLPPLNGRRRTLSKMEDLDWECIDPPVHSWEAAHAAAKASEEAKRVDAQRKALPRKKAKLDKAMEFILANNVTELTKDMLREAKKKGLSRRTLFRALETLRTSPTSQT